MAGLITVLCLNPSFDRTVEVSELEPGRTNRILSSMTQAGGKGLNVATCLRNLGLESVCLGCAGTDNYEQFSKLLGTRNAWVDFERIPGSIRLNTKVVSLKGNHHVTELNEPGPSISKDDLRFLQERFRESCKKSRMAVITGSLPPQCPEGTYAAFMKDVSVPWVLDVGGRELMLGLSAHPFLIKPNLDELEKAVGRRLSGSRDIVDAAKYLCERGASCAVVSMGGDGAVITNGKDALFSPALQVNVESTVGAGDAMVSGLIAGYLKDQALDTMLRYGTAAAAASVMSRGTGLFDNESFAILLERAETRRI